MVQLGYRSVSSPLFLLGMYIYEVTTGCRLSVSANMLKNLSIFENPQFIENGQFWVKLLSGLWRIEPTERYSAMFALEVRGPLLLLVRSGSDLLPLSLFRKFWTK